MGPCNAWGPTPAEPSSQRGPPDEMAATRMPARVAAIFFSFAAMPGHGAQLWNNWYPHVTLSRGSLDGIGAGGGYPKTDSSEGRAADAQ